MNTTTKCFATFAIAVLVSLSVNAENRVAVLDFELKDLTLKPRTAEELERTASLKPLLEKALSAKGHDITHIAPEAQRGATKGAIGYIWDHPEVAAELGRKSDADFVVVGRVHKASFLFVYFMVRLVNVGDRKASSPLIVEVKGPQKQLTEKGVARLGEQIDAHIRRHGK